MLKKAPNKNKLLYIAIFIIACLFVLDLYILLDGTIDNSEPLAIHGPHVGADLNKYLDTSSNEDMGLASTIKARIRKSFYGGSRVNSRQSISMPTPTLTPTPAPTTTPTPTPIINEVTSTLQTSVVKQTAQVEQLAQVSASFSYGTDNGFGVAAGGGLTSYSQSDLDMYFSALRDLGVTWIRWDIDWPTVQPNNSTTYNWTRIDRVANTAKKYGIRSLAIITYAPDWAEISDCPSGRFCPPKDVSTFAGFAGKVAQRYEGVINAYEIWNEQNYQAFWYPNPSASVYADMLRQTYTQIKNADPNAVVLSGGLAAAGDTNGSISPKTFVSGMYSSGAKDYFDGLGLHPYSYPVAPDYIATWNSFQQMFEIREIMKANNDSSKKIWITEYGAPTDGPGLQRQLNQLSFSYGRDFMSEDSQNQMAKTAASLYSQNKNWLGGFFWYSLRDNGVSSNDPENFFGLLRNDWSRKPAFDSLRTVITGQ
jgi:GH35 family endo-1,4-beta-xylanase